MGRVLKKSRVAGGFGSGRSVEIFDRVFPGILGISGYFQVVPGISRYFLCFFMFGYTRYFGYTRCFGYPKYPTSFKTESGRFGY